MSKLRQTDQAARRGRRTAPKGKLRRAACALLLFAPLISPGAQPENPDDGAPDAGRAEDEAAEEGRAPVSPPMFELRFPWGATYGELDARLEREAPEGLLILERRAGEQIRMRSATGTEIIWFFYLPEEIAEIRVKETPAENPDEPLRRNEAPDASYGPSRIVFDRLILQPAAPPEESPLYAVSVSPPPVPLPNARHNPVVDQIRTVFPRRARSDEQLHVYAGDDGEARILLTRCGGQPCIQRITFLHRELTAQRNAERKALAEANDRAIRRRLARANQELHERQQREAREAAREERLERRRRAAGEAEEGPARDDAAP